jgi:succinyl-CoA synthetase beta subunit
MAILEINPLIVIKQGTNVGLGKKIIKDSGLNVVPAITLTTPPRRFVKAVKDAA